MREVRRECKKCGTSWVLPKKAARERKRNGLEVFGAHTMASGSSMNLFSMSRKKDRARVEKYEDQNRRVSANATCPSCGSTKFRESRA